MALRLVLTADTHGLANQAQWPDGDVLVVAGDLTGMGTFQEISREAEFLCQLPYRHKIIVAGNHDFLFQHEPSLAKLIIVERGMTYLEEETVTIDGYRFYGSPWTPRFGSWAFMAERGRALGDRWAYIPEGIDVLITHGPPQGILDLTLMGHHAGDEELKRQVEHRIKPKLHVFGHIHEAYGTVMHDTDTTFINAALCDVWYRPVQQPVVFDLEAGHD